MDIVFHVLEGVFVILALVRFYAAFTNGFTNVGLAIRGFCYLVGAIVASILNNWYPFLIVICLDFAMSIFGGDM